MRLSVLNNKYFKRNVSLYEKYFKRPFDVLCAVLGCIILLPVMLIIALLIRIKLGSPVIFKQRRPGLNEKIFTIYKFRTMTDEKDEKGELLPDDIRLTKFGDLLRRTSLDELPEIFNILNGTMSLIGPRPQLVRDMIFMTPEQRKRHCVRPGLSGLAQTRGRNALNWEDKLLIDLEYINNISFEGDLKIIFDTVNQILFRKKGLREKNVDEIGIVDDYGDYLLKSGQITKENYDKKQEEARRLLEGIN